MNEWTFETLGIGDLDPQSRALLKKLAPVVLPAGHILFRPGDEVSGFVMVLSGRTGVYLVGPNGRELLLYNVTPGTTCVQTTLGLLGEQHYTGEAVAETDISVIMVPKELFMELMARSECFRNFVFRAFAERLQSVMGVLENVAFVTVESRLARMLIKRQSNGIVQATHQEMAIAIGTSREVVSRRLEAFSKLKILEQDRGIVKILDAGALARRAE